MKKKIFAFSFALIFTFINSFSVFASEKLELNSAAEAAIGDTVTYSLYLEECTKQLQGIQMYIYFDENYLEIVPDSSVYEVLGTASDNLDRPGYMTFNWTNFSELADFSEKGSLVSIDFKVLKGGKTDITYFVREMYDENMEYLKSFKFTCDISVNGENVAQCLTPALNKDTDVLNNRQGGFINYEDGMGDENFVNADEHIAVTGNPNLGTQNVKEEIDVNNQSQSSLFSDNIIVNCIIISAIVLILIASALIIMHKKKQEKIVAGDKTE